MVDHLSRIDSGEPATRIEDNLSDSFLFKVDAAPDWYVDVCHILSTGSYPSGYTPLEKRQLLLKSKPFTLLGGQLYKAGPDGILQRCVNPHKVPPILEDAHGHLSSGHYPGPITAQRILQSGLWWPYLFRDAVQHSKACDTCQRCGPNPSRQSNRPLHISLS